MSIQAVAPHEQPLIDAAKCRGREFADVDMYTVREAAIHARAFLAALLWVRAEPLAGLGSICCLPTTGGQSIEDELRSLRVAWSWMRVTDEWKPDLDAMTVTTLEADRDPGVREHLVFIRADDKRAHVVMVASPTRWLLDVGDCR